MYKHNKKYQLIAYGDSVIIDCDKPFNFITECKDYIYENSFYTRCYLSELTHHEIFRILEEEFACKVKIRKEEFKPMRLRTYNVTLSSSDIVTFITNRELIEVIDYLTSDKYVELYESESKYDGLPTIIFRKHIVKIKEVK